MPAFDAAPAAGGTSRVAAPAAVSSISSTLAAPDRGRQRQTETDRHMQTDRQTNRQAGKQAGKQAGNRQIDRQTDRQTDI